jgi:hypothetical protein
MKAPPYLLFFAVEEQLGAEVEAATGPSKELFFTEGPEELKFARAQVMMAVSDLYLDATEIYVFGEVIFVLRGLNIRPFFHADWRVLIAASSVQDCRGQAPPVRPR